MDRLYSLLLLVALCTAGLGAVLSGVRLFARRLTRRGWRQAALVSGTLALASGVLSAIIHLASGHGAASAEPMPPTQFFVHHTAYWLVLALCVLIFFGMAVSKPRAK